MPALDTTFGLPATAAANPAETYAAAADNSAGQSSSGNEFSRMMDQALAPAADRKTPARTDSTTATPATPLATGRAKSPAIRGQAKAVASSATAVARADANLAEPAAPAAAAGDSATDKTSESSATVTPDPAKTAEAVPAAPALVEPLPVFQPLPFAAYFRSAAGMGNSAGASAGLMTSAINPLTSALTGGDASAVTLPAPAILANATAPATPTVKSASPSTGPVLTGETNSAATAALLKTLAPSPTIPASLGPEAGQPALSAAAEPSPTSGWAAAPVPTAVAVSVLPFDPVTASIVVKPSNPAASLASETAAAQATSPAPLTSSVQVTLSNPVPSADQTNSPVLFTADTPVSVASPDRAVLPGSLPELVVPTASRVAGLSDQPVAVTPEMVSDASASPTSLTTSVSPSASVLSESDPAPAATSPLAAAMMQKAWPGKEKSAAGEKTNAANDAGTGVAFNDSAMKKNENTNKVAGLDVKVLPGSVTELAREKNLPPHLVVAPVNAPENRPNDLSGVSSLPGTPAAETASAVTMVDLPSLSDARLRALERTHDMVALHALRLMESRSDTLQVTIKPAVGTELSLELRHRNGAIEAQATVERGDFQYLNQHWPELQQKLEQRGIRLSPLGGESNLLSSDGSGQNEARQQAAQEEAAMQASAFAEFASVGNWGGATARLAVDYDGWESWA